MLEACFDEVSEVVVLINLDKGFPILGFDDIVGCHLAPPPVFATLEILF